MAKEKSKYDLIDNVPEEPKKTKRNRKKTECVINRRNGCGVCGSLNTCIQGVRCCDICGEEEEFLCEDSYMFDWKLVDFCDCEQERTKNGYKIPKYYRRYVGKCLDCGAVMGKFCPNDPNKKKSFENYRNHSCWMHWDGRKYCRDCGFKK